MVEYAQYSFDRTKFDPPSLLEVARVESLRNYVLDSTPYRLDFHDLTLVTAGRGRYWIDDRSWDVSPGSVIVTEAGRVRRSFVDGLCGIAVFFTTDFRGLRFRPVGGKTVIDQSVVQPDPKLAADLQFQFQAMLPDYRLPFAGSAEVAHRRLDLVLSLLSRDTATASPANVVDRFLALLEDEYAHHHLPSHYAERLGFSVSYLSRECRKVFGLSAREVIHDRLSLEARRLLIHTNQSVQTVSHRLGFDDPSHFTKFFKRRNVIAPRSYRSAERAVLWSGKA